MATQSCRSVMGRVAHMRHLKGTEHPPRLLLWAPASARLTHDSHMRHNAYLCAPHYASCTFSRHVCHSMLTYVY